MGGSDIMQILVALLTVSLISLSKGQLCCSTAQSKCATACAGKSCDLSCSSDSTCCLFGNCATCGPYTCSQLSNACTATSSDTTVAATTAAEATTAAATTEAVTTAAATTTVATTAAACQIPGNAMCWNKNTGSITGDACCEGSECLPWLGSSGVAGSSYCQYRDCLPAGGSCNARKGTCCTGTSCTAGVCA